MTCPNLDRTLAALHCGEPIEPDCPECVRALADEARFVSLVERGLAGIRPISPIAPLVMERIAAEKPAARPAARRRYREARRLGWVPLAAAAAVVLAVTAAIVFRPRPSSREAAKALPARETERASEEIAVEKKIPPSTPPRDLTPPTRAPEALSPPPPPMPEPGPVATPPPPAPPVEERPVEMPRPTVAEPARVEIAAAVQTGSVTVGGRKANRLASGEDFRAEGRTRLSMPFATVDFDGGTNARFEAGPTLGIVLHDGEARVEADADAPLELRLAVPVRSATTTGRFVVYARPDRVYVEEGAGRAGTATLVEGQQYRLAAGKEPSAERRTLGSEKWRGAVARETLVWAPALDKGRTPWGYRVTGQIDLNGIRSAPIANPFYSAQSEIYADDHRLVVVKPETHLRFRYLLRKPGPMLLQMANVTKKENFQVSFDRPVLDAWTTVTLRLVEIPVNPGGRKDLVVETGDVIARLTWFVGRPGQQDAEIHVRDIQILDLWGPVR
jgi:hypothetical protein